MANERWGDEGRRYWDDDRFGHRRQGYGAGGAYGREGYDPDYYRPEPYEPRSYGYASGYGYGVLGYPDYDRYGERYRPAYGQRGYGQRYGRDYGGDYDYGRIRYGYGPGGYVGGPYRGSREDWGGDYDQIWRGRNYEGRYSGWGAQRPWTERVGDELRSWAGDDAAERRRLMDSRAQYHAERRGYSGRGPRGYTRSDERIHDDVCDRLSADWRVDASDIEVKVNNGEVTLTGTVDSREAKRYAEDLADDVLGVRHVQNNIRLAQSATSAAEAPGASTTGATRGTH